MDKGIQHINSSLEDSDSNSDQEKQSVPDENFAVEKRSKTIAHLFELRENDSDEAKKNNDFLEFLAYSGKSSSTNIHATKASLSKSSEMSSKCLQAVFRPLKACSSDTSASVETDADTEGATRILSKKQSGESTSLPNMDTNKSQSLGGLSDPSALSSDSIQEVHALEIPPMELEVQNTLAPFSSTIQSCSDNGGTTSALTSSQDATKPNFLFTTGSKAFSFSAPANMSFKYASDNAFGEGNNSSVKNGNFQQATAPFSTTTDSVWSHINQRTSSSVASSQPNATNRQFSFTATSSFNPFPATTTAGQSLSFENVNKKPTLNFVSPSTPTSLHFGHMKSSTSFFGNTFPSTKSNTTTSENTKTLKLKQFATVQESIFICITPTKTASTSESNTNYKPFPLETKSSFKDSFSMELPKQSPMFSCGNSASSEGFKQMPSSSDVKLSNEPFTFPACKNFKFRSSASSPKANENVFGRTTFPIHHSTQRKLFNWRRFPSAISNNNEQNSKYQNSWLPSTPNEQQVKFIAPTEKVPLVDFNSRYQCITMMKDYRAMSFEEIRLDYYKSQHKIFVFGSPTMWSYNPHNFGGTFKGLKQIVHKNTQTTVNSEHITGLLEMWKILECPVCLDIVKPPIQQCARGHHVCNDCWPRVQVCPLCKRCKSGIRNYALESVLEKVLLPCKYRIDGCEALVQNPNREQHEKTCFFRTFNCPLECCVQSFPYKKMLEHFKNNHSLILTSSINSFNIGPYTWNTWNMPLAKLIHVFALKQWGIFFLCHKEVQQMSYLWVQMIHAANEDYAFSYQIEISDKTNTMSVSYKGPILHLSSNAQEIQHKCLLVSAKLLSSLRDGAFKTSVKIWKSSTDMQIGDVQPFN